MMNLKDCGRKGSWPILRLSWHLSGGLKENYDNPHFRDTPARV
jgi:hypothetical protein